MLFKELKLGDGGGGLEMCRGPSASREHQQCCSARGTVLMELVVVIKQ